MLEALAAGHRADEHRPLLMWVIHQLQVIQKQQMGTPVDAEGLREEREGGEMGGERSGERREGGECTYCISTVCVCVWKRSTCTHWKLLYLLYLASPFSVVCRIH